MKRIFTNLIAVLLLLAAIGVRSPDVLAAGSKLGVDDQPSNQVQTQTQAPPKSDNPFVNAANGSPDGSTKTEVQSWFYDALSIFGRLLLAVGLSSVLAFRPRQDVP